jgi:hypothetical protein
MVRTLERNQSRPVELLVQLTFTELFILSLPAGELGR